MLRMPVRMAGLLVLLTLLSASGVSAQKTVVLVRHAEKVDASDDPPLSDIGQRRAAALASALAAADVRAIYITQYRRTRESALPLARALGMEPRVVRAGDVQQHARATAAAILADTADGIILVVGHSNTIPAIITALGGPAVPPISDDSYDDLFVLQLADPPRLVHARYGDTTSISTPR